VTARTPPRRGAPRAVAGPAAALALGALLCAACTFDFDASRYTYPGETPTGCRTDADCAGRAAAPCGSWVCGAAGVCEPQTVADGTACDAGDPCTAGATCTGGVCGGGGPACDDGVACTTDVCDPLTGACAHTPDDARCEEGGACLTPRCDPALGCILLRREDGAACDDRDACTIDDACREGRCAGAPRDCRAEAPCREDTCDSQRGCSDEPAPDGTACPPPDPCAERGACVAGACQAIGSVCECQSDADCEPFQSEDRCAGAYVCLDRRCVIDEDTVPQCPGLLPGGCAESVCEPASGECVEGLLPAGRGCDDGDPCTTEDVCDGAGTCRGTATCDDGDPCTDDACDPVTGACEHTARPAAAACDDGDDATVGDACLGGRCLGWTVTSWRDRGRATRLDGVTWSSGALYAIGRSRDDAQSRDESFVAVVPARGNPALASGALRNDAVYTRLNGGAAVGTGGAVTLHEAGAWARSTALEDALAALPGGRVDLTGVWPQVYTVGGDAATTTRRAIWFSGRRDTADVPGAWLARCTAALAGASWSCAWLGDEPAFGAGAALAAVAAFVAGRSPCGQADAPLCFDPDASMSFAAGTSFTAGAPPVLYRGRPSGNDEPWQDARLLAGVAGSFRDLHGSGPANVWAVGREGLLVRWNGAGWVPTTTMFAGWELNGVWASEGLVLVAATRQEREGEGAGALVLRFAVFAGARVDGSYEWRRLDLARTVLCAEDVLCPALPEETGALVDVWATGEAAGGAPSGQAVAVGWLGPPAVPSAEAVVYRLDPGAP
jgi:hypothetical protein